MKDIREALKRFNVGNFRLLLLREGRAGLRQLELRGKPVMIGLVLTVILLPVGLYVSASLLLDTVHSNRVARLQRDNKQLVSVIDEFQRRIESLEREMDVISSLDEDLRAHAKLPAIPSDIRKVGIGGTMSAAASEVDYLLPSADQPLYDLGKSLDILNRGVQLEKISYEEIRSELKNDLVRLNNTPSTIPLAFGTYKYSTSSYGYRTHPVTLEKLDFHPGLDFAVEIGTPVMSTADGKVIATKYDSNLGLYVKIDHGNGFKTIYGHLRKFSVQKGDIVSRNDVIGKSGNSGRSTGAHLHYEVRHYNQRQNPSNYF
ncbi:M23 family metallopeptidase [Candidatus Neomarinimicrobiota bacterium]